MAEPSRERIARNQASYRAVNEAIRAGGRDQGAVAFVCECANFGCNQLIELSRAEYETIRGSSERFLVLPGHEMPEAETIVADLDGSFVVEKDADIAPITQAADPRR
jgi:hypothetical protein